MEHTFTLTCDVCNSKNVSIFADTFREVQVQCLECDVEKDESHINPDIELVFPEDKQ